MTLVDDRLSTTRTGIAVQPPQPDVNKPTRQMVVDAIVAEATAKGVACSRSLAKKVLHRVNEMAFAALQSPYNMVHLTKEDMRDVHGVMDVIMADHPMRQPIDSAAVPATGSAHDLINRWSPAVTGNVVGIVHTKDRVRGNVYCATAVQMHRVG